MKKSSENNLWHTVVILSAIILWGAMAYGQIKEVPKNIVNKNAATAILIRDSIIHPEVPTRGTMSDYWYKFIPEKDTDLIFDIVAIDPTHQYDFDVYQYEKANSTNSKTRNLKGVRTCFSNSHYNQHGPRGLSASAKKDSLETAEGYVYGYVRPLRVKAGDSCYIVVHWMYDNSWQKGFKLYLYNYWQKKPKHLLAKPKEIILENVLFETNKSTLLKPSYSALDTLIKQLTLNKTMAIEIKGHTDNKGDEIKNQELSERRAKAVFDYLVSKNIPANRLSYRGLGGKEPITTNETEEGRRKNRRVAFVVVTK